MFRPPSPENTGHLVEKTGHLSFKLKVDLVECVCVGGGGGEHGVHATLYLRYNFDKGRWEISGWCFISRHIYFHLIVSCNGKLYIF